MLGISSYLGCEVGSHCRRDRAYSVAGDVALPGPAVCIILSLALQWGTEAHRVTAQSLRPEEVGYGSR